ILFCVLQLCGEADPSLLEWSGLPYLYFGLHWLAMSHSCYNPLIYCWLNARFRSAFCVVLRKIWCKPRGEAQQPPEQLLNRMNTCTTYISMRRPKHRDKPSSYLEHQI
ncbi:hypothetical protein AAG570_003379, partial [Ranatra chinensis]